MSNRKVKNRLELEEKLITYKNFAGKAGQFNEEGDRSFSIVIEDPIEAEDLKAAGWNIREMRRQEGDDVIRWHLPVAINFDSYTAPRVVAIKESGRVVLNENTIDLLDYSTIKMADVVLNPYNWTVRGESGVKAYLHSMFAVIDESRFDRKWADVPVISG